MPILLPLDTEPLRLVLEFLVLLVLTVFTMLMGLRMSFNISMELPVFIVKSFYIFDIVWLLSFKLIILVLLLEESLNYIELFKSLFLGDDILPIK